MSEQNSNEQLLAIIRSAMKPKSATQKSNGPVVPLKARGPQRTKLQPQLAEHGKLGDFTRSNSNPPTRTNNTALLGYEEVPKTRFSQNKTNNAKDADKPTLTAETEMVRKAIRVALNRTGGAPSKKAAKQMSAPKMTRSDRVFSSSNGCGVGSSRSVTLGIIKAIAHPETGCIVRKESISLTDSQKNSNTTQGGYFPQIVE